MLSPCPQVSPSLRLKSSADEMNNLYAVAFFEARLRPVGAAYDLAIEFDGEAFGRKA